MIFRFENGQFGDTFVARQHNTKGIFLFSVFFLYNQCFPLKRVSSECNQNKTHITKVSLKSVNIITFFLGQLSANLEEILISGFHGNHCQKKGMLCFVKVFQQV